jgi:hypothetical protein
MSPTERPTGSASAHQLIIRETQQLQRLVQALSDGGDANFRAIHEVASRIMQVVYEGWKTADLAKIPPHDIPRRRGGGGIPSGARRDTRRRQAHDDSDGEVWLWPRGGL